MKRWALLLFFLLIRVDAVCALEVEAYADRTRIALTESVQLSVVVKDGEGEVDVSAIDDFKVISRGSSSSVRIVNSEMSKETTYTYTLIPLKQGNLKIPGLPVTSGGKRVMTKPIGITVSKASGNKDGGADIWVAAEVSDATPYVGQQFIYSFKLFHGRQITDARFENLAFDGFTSEQIEKERTYETVVSGRRYSVIEVKFVLVPIKPGRQIIAPAVLSCNAVKKDARPRRGFDAFFDDPFFGRARLEPRTFRTKELIINVKSLPPVDAGKTFSGLVGRFDFSAELDRPTLSVGDSATLSLTVSGEGNIKDAAAPDIRISDRFKVYQDTPEEDVFLGENGYSGKKVFRVALVPVKPGRDTVGPFEFVYFDTGMGRYQTLKTTAFHVAVSPSAAENQDTAVSDTPQAVQPEFKKKKVEFVHRDILPIKEDLNALKNREGLSFGTFLLLLLIPGLAYAAGKIIHLRIHRDENNAMQMARRARAAIMRAEKHISDDGTFLAGLYSAIVSMTLAAADAKGEAVTTAEMDHILSTRGIDPDTRQQAMAFLNDVESCRYGGRAPGPDVKARLLADIKSLSRRLL